MFNKFINSYVSIIYSFILFLNFCLFSGSNSVIFIILVNRLIKSFELIILVFDTNLSYYVSNLFNSLIKLSNFSNSFSIFLNLFTISSSVSSCSLSSIDLLIILLSLIFNSFKILFSCILILSLLIFNSFKILFSCVFVLSLSFIFNGFISYTVLFCCLLIKISFICIHFSYLLLYCIT